jgi:hypothetical protein
MIWILSNTSCLYGVITSTPDHTPHKYGCPIIKKRSDLEKPTYFKTHADVPRMVEGQFKFILIC